VAAARRSADPAADAHRVDIAAVAVVDRAVGDLGGAPGTARVAIDRPGRIVVDTWAPARQVLVVTERFHDGWRTRVDGRDVATLRVYGDFLGCVVEPGIHQAALTFEPHSFRAGLRYMWSGLGLTAGAFALIWCSPAATWRRRRGVQS
jgi:hypothetical protein